MLKAKRLAELAALLAPFALAAASLGGLGGFLLLLVAAAIGCAATAVFRSIVLALIAGYPLLFLAASGARAEAVAAFYVVGACAPALASRRYVGARAALDLLARVRSKPRPSAVAYSASALLLALGLAGLASGELFVSVYGSLLGWLCNALAASIAAGLLSPTRSMAIAAGALSVVGAPSVLFAALSATTAGALVPSTQGVLLGLAVGELVESSRAFEEARGFLGEVSRLTKGKWKWKRTDRPFAINVFEHRNPHIVIFGESGSGKSTLAKVIAKGASKQGVAVVVLDFHGEYGDLSESGFRVVNVKEQAINPLELCGEPPRARALELSYTLSSIFSLGSIQRSLLLELIREAYEERGIKDDDPATWSLPAPTFSDLCAVVERRLRLARKREEAARLESIYRYVSLLEDVASPQSWRGGAELLLAQSTVVDLSELAHEGLQSLYADVLLRAIYAYKASAPEKPSMVVVDEAHRLVGDKPSREILSKLLAESRKYKLSLVLISQNPSDFDFKMLSNASTKISFRLTEAKSVDYAARLLAPVLDSDILALLKNTLKALPTGTAIVSYEPKGNFLSGGLAVVEVRS